MYGENPQVNNEYKLLVRSEPLIQGLFHTQNPLVYCVCIFITASIRFHLDKVFKKFILYGSTIPVLKQEQLYSTRQVDFILLGSNFGHKL